MTERVDARRWPEDHSVRVLVFTGSRDLGHHAAAARAFVKRMLREHPERNIVVVGDSRGFDAIVRDLARGHWTVLVARPAWDAKGKAAGPMRNRIMLSLAGPGAVVCGFTVGGSRGTASTLEAAKHWGMTIEMETHDE